MVSSHGMLLVRVILILMVTIATVLAAPHRLKRRDDSRQVRLLKAMNYLVNFNYMSTGALVSGVQRTASSVKESIKKFQIFANLRATGELDEPTLQMMDKPRCGIPDVIWSGDARRRKRYAFQGTRWNKKTLTWSMLGFTPDIYSQGEQRNAIRNAFDVWSKVSGLKFFETSDYNADIRVSFQRYFHSDGNPFDGPRGILAHAFYPHDSVSPIAGDMHFDEDEKWSTDNEENSIDLFTVASHEIGHSLGLAHSSTPGALMAPFYGGYQNPKTFELPDDDTRAIQALYGVPDVVRPEKSKPGVIIPPKGAPDPCTTPWDAAVLGRDKRTYAFMGRFVASINNERIDANYPKPITDVFPGLNPRKGVIDAGVTTPTGYTYLFSGNEYWIYYGQTRPNRPFTRYRGPWPVSSSFSSNFPSGMDALTMWSGNGQIYAFKGSQYWRLNPKNFQVAPGYPRISKFVWKGIPTNVDASVTWSNGRTYFFKGSMFFRLNNNKLRLSKKFPKDISTGWIGCGIKKAVGRAVKGNT